MRLWLSDQLSQLLLTLAAAASFDLPFFSLFQPLIFLQIDMVAALGETTAGPALPRLRDQMLTSPEGRAILKHRPRVNTDTVDMVALSRMPEGTWGHTYATWLDRCGVTPDTREPVGFFSEL